VFPPELEEVIGVDLETTGVKTGVKTLVELLFEALPPCVKVGVELEVVFITGCVDVVVLVYPPLELDL
jgi:hypothetical protein